MWRTPSVATASSDAGPRAARIRPARTAHAAPPAPPRAAARPRRPARAAPPAPPRITPRNAVRREKPRVAAFLARFGVYRQLPTRERNPTTYRPPGP
ncbi:MAG: hypothetical protein CMH38_10790 [Microbacterium sp.]|nr:hypothetical protein [Microbacterium sp.]HBS72757.1 hypothetical protein [Microbacterium sp.]